MWCNNCCLVFPIRGGAMWLGGFIIILNAVGGILLFLWGSYFFSTMFSYLFGGFSMIQAALTAVAFLALCNWSYMLTRIYIFVNWLVLVLAVARIGLMAYRLEANKDWMSSECWGAVNDKGVTPMGTSGAFYCNTPIDTFITYFVIGLVVDLVLNSYFYFVLWRFYVRMRLYPLQKTVALNYEQGLYEY